jgi:glycosyltransferase involved in cell wall biosynthesis
LKNPRIYIAIATFHPIIGGSETMALLQARILRERGYEATIITFHHYKASLSNEEMEGVPIIRIAGVLLGDREKLPRLLQRLLYVLALVVMGWTLWLHRRNYDVLHVYQLNLLAIPTALACRFSGKPMILAVQSAGFESADSFKTSRSLVVGELNATAPWLQVIGKTKVGGDLADLERFGKPVVRFTNWLLLQIPVVIVVLSSRMKRYLEAHDFHMPDVQLIPNGVDITRFTPIQLDTSLNKRAKVVVCVSRLSYEKGVDVLLQAWKLVKQELPTTSDTRLIIVGNGEIQTQLEYMAKALGIEDSVEFMGVRSDIEAQLHRGELAVLPSRVEGMPVALLEAMACGLPCVATRVSGSEDIIQNGVNGLLVESEDYQGMALALLTLLRDSTLSLKFGHAARTTIEQHYSLQQTMDAFIGLYQRVSGFKSKRMNSNLESSTLSLREDM